MEIQHKETRSISWCFTSQGIDHVMSARPHHFTFKLAHLDTSRQVKLFTAAVYLTKLAGKIALSQYTFPWWTFPCLPIKHDETEYVSMPYAFSKKMCVAANTLWLFMSVCSLLLVRTFF